MYAHANLLTIDRFLVQGVDEVPWILDGVLEVADGVCAAAVAPHALLGGLGLVLHVTESGLFWTGHTDEKEKVNTYDRNIYKP